ncbi:MAG: hypothetical protein D5R98_02385 [Desulfonatronovibrio sp. MSAO_Bac4]|nr:MAG: hypothetical protein D5R98_02385 [Desulfonatronovibrio sp. MSAO_Bac4]
MYILPHVGTLVKIQKAGSMEFHLQKTRKIDNSPNDSKMHYDLFDLNRNNIYSNLIRGVKNV